MKQAFLGDFLTYSSLGKITSNSKVTQQPKPSHFDLYFENETIQYPVYAIPTEISFSEQRSQQLFSQFIRDIQRTFSPIISAKKATAIIIATTCYDLPLMESDLKRADFISDNLNPLSKLESDISSALGFTGPCFTINTACSSSSNAALFASKLINQQNYNNVLVLSIEFINRISISGFSSLQLLRKNDYEPFKHRTGMILGECLSAQLITSNDQAASYRIINGFNSVDTTNITTSDTQGNGFYHCMRNALKHSSLNYSNIKLVKSHGVGTESSDSSEINALKQFGDISQPTTVALKPWIGHTLAASGMAELQLLHTIKNAPIAQLESTDSKCPELLYKAININSGDIVLSNQFAFGGNNSCLLLEKA